MATRHHRLKALKTYHLRNAKPFLDRSNFYIVIESVYDFMYGICMTCEHDVQYSRKKVLNQMQNLKYYYA